MTAYRDADFPSPKWVKLSGLKEISIRVAGWARRPSPDTLGYRFEPLRLGWSTEWPKRDPVPGWFGFGFQTVRSGTTNDIGCSRAVGLPTTAD